MLFQTLFNMITNPDFLMYDKNTRKEYKCNADLTKA